MNTPADPDSRDDKTLKAMKAINSIETWFARLIAVGLLFGLLSWLIYRLVSG